MSFCESTLKFSDEPITRFFKSILLNDEKKPQLINMEPPSEIINREMLTLLY